LKASGARPAGPLARPHGISQRPGGRTSHQPTPASAGSQRMPHRCSGATIGDSHKGPLNNRGKPTSSRKKRKTQTNRRAQNPHTTRSRPWWPPWPTKVTSLSTPSGKVRLARGLSTPSGEVGLARGLSAPSGEVCHTQGPNAPLERGPPRSRVPARTSSPHLLARPSHLKALTPAGLRHDPDAPGNHASALFHRLLGQDHPRHCTALCGEAGVSSVTLCRLLLYD
jgi:hypothetical protein